MTDDNPKILVRAIENSSSKAPLRVIKVGNITSGRMASFKVSPCTPRRPAVRAHAGTYVVGHGCWQGLSWSRAAVDNP